MGKKFKSGYTLTELAVAIAFISVLLLTIAVVTLNLANMYHKGTTLKSVNTIGLELIDEFSVAVASATPKNYLTDCRIYTDAVQQEACRNDHGMKFFFQAYTNKDAGDGEGKKITKNNTALGNATQQYGIFCTGKYTYAWNTGYVLSQKGDFTKSSNIYSGGKTMNSGTFRLKKYFDEGGKICLGNLDLEHDKYTLETDFGATETPISDELINTKDIAIYDFTVDPPIQAEESTQGALLVMHLTLGSITGGVDVNTDYSGCDTEAIAEKGSYDMSHCAAYQFTFTSKAQGGNGGA